LVQRRIDVTFDPRAVADRGFGATVARSECLTHRFIYRKDRFYKYSTARDRPRRVLACHVVRFTARFARFVSASTWRPAASTVLPRPIARSGVPSK